MTRKKYNSQSGNMLFILLSAVVAFALLSFAITQQSQTSNKMTSREQANLAATEVLSYANSLRAVAEQMILLEGVSDTNTGGNGLLFSSPHTNAAYGVPDDQPHTEIFNMRGGKAIYQKPASSICAKKDCSYEFTGQMTIPGVGSDTKPELVMTIKGVDSIVCEVINDILSNGWTETPEGPTVNLVRFDGTNYDAAPSVNLTTGNNRFDNKHVFCYRETLQRENIFVQVLKPR